jgi:hypothetical protein
MQPETFSTPYVMKIIGGTNMLEGKFQLSRDILINAIRPALNLLGAGGLAAEQLMLGTGIQESLLVNRQQIGGGPALGLFQMETATHDDCWKNYLKFQTALADNVKQTLGPGQQPIAQTLRLNDRYADDVPRALYAGKRAFA